MTRKPEPAIEPNDVGFTALRAVATLIPGASAVVELVLGLSGAVVARRREAWLREVVEDLGRLRDRVEGLRLEQLARDDAFVSTLVQGLQIAVRTRHDEKLEALRHAVLNVAAGHLPAADEPETFLHLVDRLTPTHLALLRFFDDPAAVAAARGVEVYGGATATLLEQVFFPRPPRAPRGV